MKAYFTNLPTKVWILLVVPAVMLAYPIAQIVIPTVVRAVGYNSSSDKRVHFGLGDAAMADRIEVHWPTGHRQILVNVRGDQILTITQDEDSSAPKYKRR